MPLAAVVQDTGLLEQIFDPIPVKKRTLARRPTDAARNVKGAPTGGSAKPNPPVTRKGTQP